MKYLEIEIKIPRTGSAAAEAELTAEAVTGLLLSEGITDVAVEDPQDFAQLMESKESYYWDYVEPELLQENKECVRMTFYLGEDEAERAEALKRRIKEEFPQVSAAVSCRDDAQWKDKWKEYFKPAHVTERIVVKPTWEEYEPAAGETVLEIDPGMAFGTGTHETTSLCIKLIEKYLRPQAKVLDVGCGSGILSVAAALLGAGEVLAVDIDPEAVRVTGENAALNGCGERIVAREGDLAKGVDFKADLIAANLMADLVIALSGSAAQHMEPGGIYITSGILTEKRDTVAAAIEESGFEILETREDGIWCAIAARLK